MAGPNDLVELDYDGATGAINVRVGEVHRILRGLDTGSINEPRQPDLDFECKATLSADRLSRALRAAKFVGELVDLSLDKNQMTVSVTVEAGEGVNVRFDAGEMSELVAPKPTASTSVSYTHLRAHETLMNLVCRLLLEKKKRRRE